MRKHVIHIIDSSILILCFFFIISTFFKLISWTALDSLIYNDITVLLMVWITGIILSMIFTRPLYRWILRLRHL